MTFRVTGRTLRSICAFRPTGASREVPSLAFGSILPWLSGFVFPRDGIPLASEYQSKQYHVARIRPSCHGKTRAGRRSPLASPKIRSSPNFSYNVLVLPKKRTKKDFDGCTPRFPKGIARPDDKSRSHKYHVRQLNFTIDFTRNVLKINPKEISESNLLGMTFRGKISRGLEKLRVNEKICRTLSTERCFGRKCVFPFIDCLASFPTRHGGERTSSVAFATLGFPSCTSPTWIEANSRDVREIA